ncbi:hypothetical protein BUE80_DR012387 [Diplocarpon rosae]|nr:hypothetical protein BUE80_DR012387 [Diplocarpon rosae]
MHLSVRALGLLPLVFLLASRKPADFFILSILLYLCKPTSILIVISYFNSTIAITTILTLTFIFSLLQLNRNTRDFQQASTPCEFPVKPMLFPCETAHQRMFPTKHSFVYSYLLVGIPVGWQGRVGGLISVDCDMKPRTWRQRLLAMGNREAWFTVNGDDYLERGHVEEGLNGKLQRYLEGQVKYPFASALSQDKGVDPKQYSYVYLLTAARFLGYASNPVSIWHLYSASKELKALILEVNNTFDEKRIYFLEAASEASPAKADETPKPPRYTGAWPKDFYVSTFNSRNGSYSLSASDPLFPAMSQAGPINTTITLINSSSKPKLVARLYSTEKASDPTALGAWGKTWFIARWWWVGLATFPRTIKEALRLLLGKGMPWVFRPEPRKETMSRRADPTEVLIEQYFRAYLHQIVTNSQDSVALRYVTSGLKDSALQGEVMLSQSKQPLPPSPSASKRMSTNSLTCKRDTEVELHILTPLFYTRLVQYPTIIDALQGELQSGIVSFSSDLLTSLDLTATLLDEKMSKNGKTQVKKLGKATVLLSQFLSLALNIVANLRTPPRAIAIPLKERSAFKPLSPTHSPKISSKPELNPFDIFILNNASFPERKQYVKALLRLSIARYFALGFVEVLDLELFFVKMGVLWGSLRWVLS